MDTKALHCFVQVYQKGSINKAAQQLYISQQGLCAILDKLEEEIGVKLLKRTSKGTHLTSNGEFLLPRAKEILRIEKECRMYFDKLKSGAESLPLICAFGTYVALVSRYIEAFKTQKKDLRVEITELPDTYCEHKLKEGFVDIGFTTSPINTPVFESHHLESHQICAAVHESCQIAHQPSLDIEQLEGLPIVLLGRDFQSHQDFVSRCAEAGFSPNIQFEAAEIALVHRLAEKGEGVGITTKPTYEEYMQPYMHLIPFNDPTFTWDIYLTVRRALPLESVAASFYRFILFDNPATRSL